MKKINYPPAGELHRRVGRQTAPQDWQVGCTLRGASGLHIKWNWAAKKGGPDGSPFLQPASPFFAARRTAFLCGPPFCLVFCAACRQFTFFIWKHDQHDPPARPALQLVLSTVVTTLLHLTSHEFIKVFFSPGKTWGCFLSLLLPVPQNWENRD